MLAEFLTWWRDNLLELVPARLREGPGANALVVDAGPGAVALARRRRGVEARLGRAALDAAALRAAIGARPASEPVVLRPPPEDVLERPVALPLAAERDIERVLAYDMERLTPFGADEVYWGYAVDARDRARGRLAIRLALVPRAAVAPVVEALAAADATPSLIEARAPHGTLMIRLAHAVAPRARITPRRAAMALAALAAVFLVSLFLHQSLELDGAEGALAGLAPQFRLVDALRQRINGGGSGDAVAREADRLGDTLVALATITNVLPDDSYLTEFTMRERKITLSGLSTSAAKLISALSANEHIRNPAFTAPVTRAENGHNDVFSIRADLAN